MKKTEVAIIGGGWAGISCAYELAKTGIKSTIIEAAPQLGGRARSIKFNDDIVDNGQHLLIGAYKNTFEILKEINAPLESFFLEKNLNIETISNNSNFKFTLPKLPYPINLIFGILNIKGCTIKEKLSLFLFCCKLKLKNFKIEQDIPIKEFLEKHKQPQKLIRYFWEPIALAALSTPISKASTEVFLEVIKNTFCFPAKNSNLIFTKKDLGNIFPIPVTHHYKNEINVLLNSRVKSIQKLDENFIIDFNNSKIETKNIIFAIPPVAASKIIKDSKITELECVTKKLDSFTYEVITTIYYKIDSAYEINIQNPMFGFVNNIGQWVFNRNYTEKSNIISVVITNNESLKGIDNENLALSVFQELNQSISNNLKYSDYKIIKEKRAAFSCIIDINKIRPDNKTSLRNVFLAGDYTKTDFPATIEGAVKSGRNCAKILLKNLQYNL